MKSWDARHPGGKLELEVNFAICLSQSSMLTQVFCPGIHNEGLDEAPWLIRIAKKVSVESAVPIELNIKRLILERCYMRSLNSVLIRIDSLPKPVDSRGSLAI